jgi:hypothetical protein
LLQGVEQALRVLVIVVGVIFFQAINHENEAIAESLLDEEVTEEAIS